MVNGGYYFSGEIAKKRASSFAQGLFLGGVLCLLLAIPKFNSDNQTIQHLKTQLDQCKMQVIIEQNSVLSAPKIGE